MFTVNKIAELINAQIFGNADLNITSLCALNEPILGALTFSTASNEKNILKALTTPLPSAIIISDKIALSNELKSKLVVLQVKNPQSAFQTLVNHFYPPKKPLAVVSSKADIDPSAKIGKNVSIGAFSVIGANVVIEDNVIIYPHVVIYENSTIGSNTIIHSGSIIRENCMIQSDCVIQNGAVIGSDGFGYLPNQLGELISVPQVGTVNIGNKVDIGANTTIDRATLGTTFIADGVKIDNQVQIGHNVKIDKHSVICGQTGIAGSVKIGKHVVLGGQTGVADHVTIKDQVRIGSSGKVERDIEKPGDYAGHPLLEATKWKRFSITSSKNNKT
jgi:UDP-3-O-[3-hydroxymyristoyl] glucosamine N-acyltransferase